MTPYYSSPTTTLYLGDSAAVLRELPGESVELVVTSPPYDQLRAYGGFTWNFEGTARELYRVLVPGGVVCWVVGDQVVKGSETLTSFKQAIYFKETVGFRMHDTMIYEKSNFAHPEKHRYHQTFEYVFVLSKGAPRCFNPIRDKKNRWAGHTAFGINSMRQADGSMQNKQQVHYADFGMRGNVWRCKTAGQEMVCNAIAHPAVMPLNLAQDLVLSWSSRGDTILDPFCGSGTSCLAAVQTGRLAIGIDCHAPYLDLAIESLRLGRRPRVVRPEPGQLEMNERNERRSK